MNGLMSESKNLKLNIDISKFLDEKGRITRLSQKKNIRVATLCYLAEKI